MDCLLHTASAHWYKRVSRQSWHGCSLVMGLHRLCRLVERCRICQVEAFNWRGIAIHISWGSRLPRQCMGELEEAENESAGTGHCSEAARAPARDAPTWEYIAACSYKHSFYASSQRNIAAL